MPPRRLLPSDRGRQDAPAPEFDLLRAQIDALHAVGINAPVYLTATWDELAAFEHPEWRTVSPDGTLPMFRPEHGNGVGWAFLDFSTPYLDYLCAQTEEVMRTYPDADGIFMDISFQLPSISSSAKTKMEAQGLDWTDERDRATFTAQSVENYFTRVRDAVRKHDPKMPLFFNSGHMRRGLRKHYADFYTHLELESLPTAGWGYEHFPLSARYVDPLGIPFLGMTGKFHTHWGEVGGYKKPEALLYECGAMLAHGARCSIGDHLHPTGSIDPSTMGIIAPAYKWVAEREAWADGTTNRAEIALLSSRPRPARRWSASPATTSAPTKAPSGCCSKASSPSTSSTSRATFPPTACSSCPTPSPSAPRSRPGSKPTSPRGGRVLMTGTERHRRGRPLRPRRRRRVAGHLAQQGRRLRPADPGPPRRLRRRPAVHVRRPPNGSRSPAASPLGEVYEPYFDRTPRHFSGHVNAASQPEPSGWACGVAQGRLHLLRLPDLHLLPSARRGRDARDRREADRLGARRPADADRPRCRAPGAPPSASQAAANRDVVHLLHAAPVLRGQFRGAGCSRSRTSSRSTAWR